MKQNHHRLPESASVGEMHEHRAEEDKRRRGKGGFGRGQDKKKRKWQNSAEE